MAEGNAGTSAKISMICLQREALDSLRKSKYEGNKEGRNVKTGEEGGKKQGWMNKERFCLLWGGFLACYLKSIVVQSDCI